MRRRYPPDDSREWLSRAESSLALAQATGVPADLEDRCFLVQQAAEKALKALLIQHEVTFPYTHNLARLLTQLEAAGVTIPPEADHADKLTRYAVVTR